MSRTVALTGSLWRKRCVWVALGGLLLSGREGWAGAHLSDLTALPLAPLAPFSFGTNGNVLSAVRAGDTLYVGGFFGAAGRLRGTLIMVDSVRGAPEASSSGVGGLVESVVADGHGGCYVFSRME